jgi:hypothetical protein
MEKCTTNIEPFQDAKPTLLERFIWLLERAFYKPMWHFAMALLIVEATIVVWLVKQQLKL